VQPRHKRFWLLALLLTYTLSGFLLLPWLAREQTVTRLSALLQRPVALETVRLNPFTLTLEVRNFSIAEASGEPLLQVGRLFADLELRSVWQRVWVVRELTLDGVQAQVERGADGSWNWQHLLPAAAPAVTDPAINPTSTTPRPATSVETSVVTSEANPVVTAPARADSGSADPAAEASAALPPLRLERARLSNSSLLFRDRATAAAPGQSSPQSAVHSRVLELPISIDLVADGFSTLPAQAAPLLLALSVPTRGQLTLAADLQLSPLQAQGKLDVEGTFLDVLNHYLPPALGLTLAAGPLQLRGQYQVQMDASGARAAVQNLDLTVNRLQLQQAGVAAPLLALAQGQVSDLQLNWPEQRVSIGALQLTDPALSLIRAADGRVQLPALPTAAAAAAPDPAAAWAVTLQRAGITGLSLALEDQTLPQPARLQLLNTRVDATGISNQPGTAIPLQVQTELASGGKLQAEGTVTLLPALDARLQLRAEALALAVLQPYLTPLAALQLQSGTLSSGLELLLNPAEPLALQGTVAVHGLELRSALDQSRLLAWEAVQLENLNFALSTGQLDVASVQIRQPYGRFLIDEQGKNNWQKLFPAAAPVTPAAVPTAASTAVATTEATRPTPPPLTVLVQAIEFEQGALDFGDLSLPIPFRVQMQALKGKVSTFDSQSRQAATISADGQVQDYGLARIEGSLQPLAPTSKADVGLIFRNLNLAAMSPYTIKFAGRAIDNGRLDLDLRYRVDKGRLRGDNNIVIADLQLGKKIPHAGALDLPLGLAVALLTGPDGKIDLALPITGDTNNPQFALGGVIRQTLGNLLLKAVTSPFRLLASLVGAKDTPIDAVGFEPGSAELLPPERETLDMLARALQQRPALALEIPAVTATVADTRALQQQAVDARVEAAIAAALKTAAAADSTRQQQRLVVMEALAAQYLPALDLQAEQARWQIPDPQQLNSQQSNPQPDSQQSAPQNPAGSRILDITAYLASLRQQLVAAEPVPPQALQTLGQTRASAIRTYLQSGPAIAPARLLLTDAKQVKLSKQKRVRVKLELASAAATTP
jgi:uncharacterized protein involved in outer membrane biogenesis